ncbi:MAG: sel1 repeat family protein, partial [Rubrivivax sp.]
GKLYLFGSAGLPQSLPTALHWLERAARQDCRQAWQLIGNHIPLALAQPSAQALAPWYERAYDDGSVHAGLVFAQLVLGDGGPRADPADAPVVDKALRALEDAARAGFPEAQWLLARRRDTATARPSAAAAGFPPAPLSAQGWLRSAADSGVAEARSAVLDQAWEAGNWDDYLARALPLAREVVRSAASHDGVHRLAPGDIALLSRVARLLDDDGQGDDAVHHGARGGTALAPDEPLCFWELAAAEHERHAQLALGLRSARMGVDGRRIAGGGGAANFKKAIGWLTQAGEQGLAQAWYALSRIYIKPEFSQRNVADAQRYLERAAEMGYRDAQLECGHNAWRARRENESNDVRAAYWLQKAAAQGSAEALALLRKIAPRLGTPPYVETGKLLDGHEETLHAHPLLHARLELAALFKLSRAEALLLDVPAADQGHCLVIDIRASYGRSKRRLVLVDT